MDYLNLLFFLQDGSLTVGGQDIAGAADAVKKTVEINIIGTSINLTNKTVTDGVFFADNVTFLSVTGAIVESLVIYKNTGIGSTSVPIAFIDVVASGLPLTPNGGNITVQWNASGIFSL